MPSKQDILEFRKSLPLREDIPLKRWTKGRGELASFYPQNFLNDFRNDILDGLKKKRKTISYRHFYDAKGSLLFEKITCQPEYYLTRAEEQILKNHADLLMEEVLQEGSLLEFGGGNGKKIGSLFRRQREQKKMAHYIPLDISKSALEGAIPFLLKNHPSLWVTGLHADYEKGLHLLKNRRASPINLFFLGSNIGNFSPSDRKRFLRKISSFLNRHDRFVFGADLKKEKKVMEKAYNDNAGLTAAFNLNLIDRIGRELKIALKPQNFRHVAFYNEKRERIEMHLECLKEEKVRIDGEVVTFKKGERIHTENSYKFLPQKLEEELKQNRFRVELFLTDPRERFGLWVARPSPFS